MTRIFLSPSDQDNNPVVGGGNEQEYAQARCAVAASILRDYDLTVKVSEAGIGDDTNGFLASIAESNNWSSDLHIADHTNAGTGQTRGISAYVYSEDYQSQKLGKCILDHMAKIFPNLPCNIIVGDHLGEVNSTNATAVLLESGYHDNSADAEIIRAQTQAMGEAIAYGVLDYLGITYTKGQPIMTPEQAKQLADLTWALNNVILPTLTRLDQSRWKTDSALNKLLDKLEK